MFPSKKILLLAKIAVIAVVLFVACGLLLNWFFQRLSHSFYIDAVPNTETDAAITKLEINDNPALIGYARSSDYATPQKTILFFGGSGDIAYNAVLGKAGLFADYVFISSDYPGTQDSAGEMNLASMQSAAIQTYDYVKTLPFVDTENIFIVGASYGTGMATYLASQRACEKLVLIAPYRDATDLFPIFKSPFGWFLTNNIETATYAQSVTAPTLIVTSDGDTTIKKSICYALADSFPNASVFEVKQVSHNDLLRSEEVLDTIHHFLDE